MTNAGMSAATDAHALPLARTVGKYRYIVLAMVTLGIAINYMDRAAMSVALPAIRADLDLSQAISGVILSAFFWSYAAGQLPMGYLAGKLGPKKIVTLSALTFGLVTLATGLAWGVVSFIVLRVLLGIGEAPAYPSAAQTCAQWFPRKERAFASGTFNNGNPIGSTLSIPLVALLVSVSGWRAAFFVLGGIAIVYAGWWWFFYSSPRESNKLGAAELTYIEAGNEIGGARKEESHVPWHTLFRHRAVWAMMLGFFCVNFCAYFFITWFPTYLITTYHLTLIKFGVLGMLPGIASMLGGWTGGLVSDWLVRRGTDITRARKICLVGGLLGNFRHRARGAVADSRNGPGRAVRLVFLEHVRRGVRLESAGRRRPDQRSRRFAWRHTERRRQRRRHRFPDPHGRHHRDHLVVRDSPADRRRRGSARRRQLRVLPAAAQAARLQLKGKAPASL